MMFQGSFIEMKGRLSFFKEVPRNFLGYLGLFQWQSKEVLRAFPVSCKEWVLLEIAFQASLKEILIVFHGIFNKTSTTKVV